MSPRDILIAFAIVLVWGANFLALKWSVAEIPPFMLTGLRYLFAALPAVFFIRRPQVPWRFMILYATFVGILQFSFAFTALKLGLPAGLSSLLIQVQVFFTFGLAVWLLGERPGVLQIVGGLIAFAGIGVIALERLEPTATVLGMFPTWECRTAELRLAAGDILAIYTDGITEAFDGQDDEFGEGRLVETLHAHRALPPRELIDAIYDGVRRFSPDEQRDDMTLIVARCCTG